MFFGQCGEEYIHYCSYFKNCRKISNKKWPQISGIQGIVFFSTGLVNSLVDFLWPIFILEVWLPGFKWDTAGPPSDDKSFVKFIHHIIFSNPIIENSRFLIINLIMLCKKVSDIWQFLSGNCSSISFKVEGCPKPIFPGGKKIKSSLALFRHCDPPTRWKSDLQGETDMSAPRKITILQFSTDDLKIKIEF